MNKEEEFNKNVFNYLKANSTVIDDDEIIFLQEFFKGKDFTAPFVKDTIIPFLETYKHKFVFDKNRRL